MPGRGRRTRDRQFEQRGVQELANFARHWVRLVVIVLAAVVGWLEIRNAQLYGFAEIVDNVSLIKIGLFMFFVGWGWGALDDIRIQLKGYKYDPGLGKTGWKEWAGIAVFLALFGTLFFIPDRPGWFQLTLLGLILVNWWTWRVIFNRTRSVIAETWNDCTAASGSKAVATLSKLLLVVEYMNGPWQRRRFVTLAALATIQIPIALLVQSGRLLPLGAGAEPFGVPGEVLISYLPGILFILYVIISETWMKVFRIRIFSDLRTIDWLEANFTLGKQRDCPFPQPHLVGAFDFSLPSNPNYEGYGPLRWMTRDS